LGVTTEAIRKRIRRGTLRAYKRDGAWRIVLPAVPGHVRDDGPDTGPDAGPDARDRLIDQLQSEVEFLRRLTEHQAGVIAELARPTPPELPAGETVKEPGTLGPSSEPPQPPTTPAVRRGWLRRLLGL